MATRTLIVPEIKPACPFLWVTCHLDGNLSRLLSLRHIGYLCLVPDPPRLDLNRLVWASSPTFPHPSRHPRLGHHAQPPTPPRSESDAPDLPPDQPRSDQPDRVQGRRGRMELCESAVERLHLLGRVSL
jgi:hypothetical protein